MRSKDLPAGGSQARHTNSASVLLANLASGGGSSFDLLALASG